MFKDEIKHTVKVGEWEWQILNLLSMQMGVTKEQALHHVLMVYADVVDGKYAENEEW